MPDAEVVLMDFPDAMRAVLDGLKVRRDAWDDKNAYVQLRYGEMRILIEGIWRPWLIADVDVMAKDWTT